MLVVRVNKAGGLEEWLYEDYKIAHKVVKLMINRYGADNVAIKPFGHNTYSNKRIRKGMAKNSSVIPNEMSHSIEPETQINVRALASVVPRKLYVKQRKVDKSVIKEDKEMLIKRYCWRRYKKLPLFGEPNGTLPNSS